MLKEASVPVESEDAIEKEDGHEESKENENELQ